MSSPARTAVNVTLIDGADLDETADDARAAGMVIHHTLPTIGVLVGEIDASAIERLRALPHVAEVELSRTFEIAPPDSPTQ